MAGDDVAQKSVSLGSCGDVLHLSIFVGLSCLYWECVTAILGCWCPINYNDNSVK